MSEPAPVPSNPHVPLEFGQKIHKPDYPISTGLLPSPGLFVAAPIRPRLLPVKAQKVQENPFVPGVILAADPASSTESDQKNRGKKRLVEEEDTIVSAKTPQVAYLDNYLDLIGKIYYTPREEGCTSGEFSYVRRTMLGILNAPVREPMVFEKWSPFEIAKFESAICLLGKNFPLLAAEVGTKSTEEVIEFYYMWKQSKNYIPFKSSWAQMR